ncbi:MAG: hypothetical protein CL955_03990 [Erythrobacteraceae bacterium]|nr:hypothetical protein [Erythrobacteraceae bacterium]
MNNPAPTLLTETEAAQRLHVCERTLRKARQAGRLHFVKLGRRICYTPADLAAFIDNQRQCAANPAPATNPAPKTQPRVRRRGEVVPFSQRRREQG